MATPEAAPRVAGKAAVVAPVGYAAQRQALRPSAQAIQTAQAAQTIQTAGGAQAAQTAGVTAPSKRPARYDRQRAAIRPAAAAQTAPAAPREPADNHDGLAPALDEAGGIVAFMKAMAGGQSVAGVDQAQFSQLWATQENEDWLKDRFRAVHPNMHEWIPSNELEAMVTKAQHSPEGANWIDLHNDLRSPTQHVIFKPEVSSHVAPDDTLVLHGHVGAIYHETTPQTKDQGPFHDELRAVFLAAPDVATAVDGLKAVMAKWVWDGAKLPKPLSPGLKDSMGRPLVPEKVQDERAVQFAQMDVLFDGLKSRYARARPRRKFSM